MVRLIGNSGKVQIIVWEQLGEVPFEVQEDQVIYVDLGGPLDGFHRCVGGEAHHRPRRRSRVPPSLRAVEASSSLRGHILPRWLDIVLPPTRPRHPPVGPFSRYGLVSGQRGITLPHPFLYPTLADRSPVVMAHRSAAPAPYTVS